jgi:hypothetical protein
VPVHTFNLSTTIYLFSSHSQCERACQIDEMNFLVFVVLVHSADIIIGCDWQISNETVTFYADTRMSNLTAVTKSEHFDGKLNSQKIQLDGQCQELDADLMLSSFVRLHGGFECFIFQDPNCESIAELLTGGRIVHFNVNMTHVMCEKCRSTWSRLTSFFGFG